LFEKHKKLNILPIKYVKDFEKTTRFSLFEYSIKALSFFAQVDFLYDINKTECFQGLKNQYF